MDAIADVLLDAMGESGPLGDSAVTGAERRRLKSTARVCASALADHMRGSQFHTTQLETSFGREDGVLAIRLPDGCVLEGRIDRVDQWTGSIDGGNPSDFLRVIDYKRGGNELLFLPYLVGTGAPEFDADANGVFWGLRQEHDAIDMAGAVMEGVSFVLRKNCEHIAKSGVQLKSIIATGGGAKSAIWCQLQADITGLPVVIPTEKEAACLGCAIIGAVADGVFGSYQEAADKIISFQHRYEPVNHHKYEKKYEKYCALYEAMLKVTRL